jgi:hypothetical protein
MSLTRGVSLHCDKVGMAERLLSVDAIHGSVDSLALLSGVALRLSYDCSGSLPEEVPLDFARGKFFHSASPTSKLFFARAHVFRIRHRRIRLLDIVVRQIARNL